MKKLLSTIMALVMLLSLMPMAVAEEETAKWSETKTEKSVAQVGDMFYETLADAVDKVANGDTIKLVKDVTGQVVIPADKTITLDLGGKTLTNSGTAIINNGTLTVDNGTIVSTKNVGIGVGDNSKTTIQPGVTIEAQEGAVITSYATGATITINGGKFLAKDNAVIAGNGSKTAGKNGPVRVNANTITINGGTFTGNIESNGYIACGIYAPWKDVITVNDGTFIVTNGIGVVARAGQVYINGGTFTCTGTAKGNVGDKEFNMDAAQALYFDDSNPSYPGYNAETDGIFVKGGAFTDLANAVKYATDGATITLAGDVTAERINLEDKSITVDLNGHTLTSTSAYGVMFCAKNGKTITVNGTTPGSKLVGTVMVTEKTDGHIVLNGGTYESDKYVPVYINGAVNTENSTLKIKDAVITAIGSSGGQDMGCGMYLAGYATSTIENTKITAPVTGIEIRAGKLDLTNCTVTGGNGKVAEVANGNGTTVTNAAVAVSQHTTKKNIDVTIKGGEYTATAALYQTNVQGTGSQGVKATVLSGMFTGEVKAATEGAITIKGGAFNVAPDAKYLAEGMIVVPGVKDAPYSVQPATSEDGNSKSEVKVDGDKVTTTVTDKATGTTTETVTDTKTGAETVTKTENKVEGNVTTKTETVTEKNAAGVTTKATETVTTEKTENGGKTTVVTEKDTLNKTETTEVTGVTAPTTASDVTLDVKNTTNVAVNKASMTALKGDTVKDVVIETKDAKLTLNKDAVKTMEGNVPANGKMTLNVTVTEEKNATTTEIEKVKVEVTAKNEAGQNVFPENTANTNGLINITIPYNGNAKYLDLWYIAANASATYMGRFPVVNGFVSFDVKHFSQYDLIPVASSGSSVIKTGAGSSAASTTQTVTTDLTPGSITKVTVDGKVVDAKYYTVSGSNVTFTAEFLKTLKNGSHTVTVENATKIAKGVFTVNNPTTAQSPTTADAGIALYAGMAIASVMGTGVVFTSRKRKNH